MSELEQLLDAHTGLAQYLDDGPGPEGVVLFEGEVAAPTAVKSCGVDHARLPTAAAGGVGDDRQSS